MSLSKDQLAADALAMKRVEVAVYIGRKIRVRLPDADYWQPNIPLLLRYPMGAAIEQGLDMLRERKQRYKDNGIPIQTMDILDY